MDSKQLRVACYARYSTSMQRGESISAQLNALTFEDYEYLIDDFRNIPHNSEKYRSLIQQFILRITVYPYRMETTLNLGFGITDDLTETVEIRRGDLYAKFKEGKLV